MLVNNPLTRPYFLGEWALGGYPEIPMMVGSNLKFQEAFVNQDFTEVNILVSAILLMLQNPARKPTWDV